MCGGVSFARVSSPSLSVCVVLVLHFTESVVLLFVLPIMCSGFQRAVIL